MNDLQKALEMVGLTADHPTDIAVSKTQLAITIRKLKAVIAELGGLVDGLELMAMEDDE